MAIKVRGPAVAKPPGPNATVGTDIYGVFAKGREKQMAESMKDALAKMEREDVAYAAQVKLVQDQTKLVASEIEHLQTIKANAEKDFAKRSDSVLEFNARETNDVSIHNSTKQLEAQKKTATVPGTKGAVGAGDVNRKLGVDDDQTRAINTAWEGTGTPRNRTPSWDELKNIEDTASGTGLILPKDRLGKETTYGSALDVAVNELVALGATEAQAYELSVSQIPKDMRDNAVAGYSTRKQIESGGGTSSYKVDLEREYKDIEATTLDEPTAQDMKAIDDRLAELYAKDLSLPDTPDSDRIEMARDEFQAHYGSGRPARYQNKRGTEALLNYIKRSEDSALNQLMLEVDNPTQSDIDTVTRAARQDAVQGIRAFAKGERPTLPATGEPSEAPPKTLPPTMEIDGETFYDMGEEDMANVTATPIDTTPAQVPTRMPDMEIKGDVPPELSQEEAAAAERRRMDAEVLKGMEDRALELEILNDGATMPAPVQLAKPPATEESRKALDKRIAEQLRQDGPETIVRRPQGPGAGEYADNLPDPALLEEPSLEIKPAQPESSDRDIELEMLEMPASELAPAPIVLPKKQTPKSMIDKDAGNKIEAAASATQMLLNEYEIERELATPYGKIVSQLVALDSTNDPEYVIGRIAEAYDDDFDVAKKATTLAFVLMNQKEAQTKLVE